MKTITVRYQDLLDAGAYLSAFGAIAPARYVATMKRQAHGADLVMNYGPKRNQWAGFVEMCAARWRAHQSIGVPIPTHRMIWSPL